MSTRSQPCPCGGASLASCCAPFLAGAALPPTAERLMRSRYTAYVLRDEDYLRATWHPSTRPTEPIIDKNEPIQWLGLEVKSALRLRQRKADHEDYVEFVARLRQRGKGQRMHEVSYFVYESDPELDGRPRWFYVDGDVDLK